MIIFYYLLKPCENAGESLKRRLYQPSLPCQ